MDNSLVDPLKPGQGSSLPGGDGTMLLWVAGAIAFLFVTYLVVDYVLTRRRVNRMMRRRRQ